MAQWEPLVSAYRSYEPPVPHYPPNVQTAILCYENGPQIECLLHYFQPLCNDAVTWFNWVASQRSPHFIRVLGLVDRRQAAHPCVIVVTEFSEHTLGSWIRTFGRVLEVEGDHRPRIDTELAQFLRGSLESLSYLWDLGFSHGNIRIDNIFLVDGAPKLGMFDYNSNVPDFQQLQNMVMEFLPRELIPFEMVWFMDSIIWGQCWTKVLNVQQWQSNIARFSAKNPAFMSATVKQRQREATYYRLVRMRLEDPELYRDVYYEMAIRLDHMLDYDWLDVVRHIPEDAHLRKMLDHSEYDNDDPFMFAKFGRHFKVHKPRNLTDSEAEDQLDSIIFGYLSLVIEVLNGFGVDIYE